MPSKTAVNPGNSGPAGLRQIAMGTLLLCVTLAAYLPALQGGILWDDSGHLTRPDLQPIHGLWRIWFDLGSTQQYYPLLYSAFWMEHQLWGDAVLGYHLTNVMLHVTSACLLVIIVRLLRLPGAWLAGFIFALHPVCVEAVAWISEQKSTLSAMFYLASALCYLNFDQSRRRLHYFSALALFILALLSKTVSATLPAALLVVLWWRRGRLDRKRDVIPLLPWLALGAGAGVLTSYVETNFVGAAGPEFALTLAQRCLLAGRVICFYLEKLLWPRNLIFFYPRWTIDPRVWWQYLFPLGILAFLGLGLWLALRGRRGPLAASLFFAGTLFPALGFFNVYPFLYSYVADHFQYLASLGVIVPAAVGLSVAAARTPAPPDWKAWAAGAVVVTLALLTWRQSAIYHDARTLYEATLVRNPDCWLAHNNLGTELLNDPGRLNESIDHFEAALRLQPNYPQTYNNLGIALSGIPGRLPEAINDFETAVRIQPDYAQAQNNLGLALARVPGRLPEAIAHFEAALRLKPDYAQAHNNLGSALSQTPGRLNDAISEYQTALRIDPDLVEAHYNLANALTRVPGRQAEAIREYQETLRLQPQNWQAHNNLGTALLAIPGRLAEAIAEYQAALRIQPDFADAHYNLGLALSRTSGNKSEAISEYEAALRINPQFEPARQMIDRLNASQAHDGQAADQHRRP
jgi:protein O-mannosyl-transferase